MAFRSVPVRKEGWDGRVGDTLTPRERQVVNAFVDAVRGISGRVDGELVRQLIRSGVEPALAALGLGSFVADLAPMVAALSAEVAAGGTAAVGALPKGVVGTYRFDVKDPRAIAWAETRAGTLIREVTDDQRIVLRDVLGQSVREGWTTDETAAALRQRVGLHQRWASAVGTARETELARLLRTGMSATTASAKADAFAARYHERLLRARAKNIARTEIQTAANQGRWLSWAQGVEGGYVAPGTKKRWQTGPLVVGPGRKQVCDLCAPLREEVVAWDQPFSNGVMMPPAHPSCRCTAVLVPVSIDEVRQRLADDNARRAQQTPPTEPAALPAADVGPSRAESRAASRAARRQRTEDAAARFGVTPEQVEAHLPAVKDLRRRLYADAARTQREAFEQLDALDAIRLKRPPRGARSAQYDWMERLHPDERARLARWWTDAPGSEIDNVADSLRSRLPDLLDLSDDEVIEDVWLRLNRQVDAAGALRRGRLPIESRYSGSVDVDDLVPNLRAEGYDPLLLLADDVEVAAAHIAEVAARQYADAASRALGSATTPIHGPSPYRMGFQTWEEEVRELELKRGAEGWARADRERYGELVPFDLDYGDTSYEELYARIVETARVAGEEVPAYAVIPWA